MELLVNIETVWDDDVECALVERPSLQLLDVEV